MGGFAWVTLATNDSYSLGALVLAHSLRQVNTAHQLAVLVTPGVTGVMREKLASVFNVIKEVNILDSRDEANLRLLQRPELGITFTKLHCWRLTQFEKCVFLDADTMVLQNADELFEREEFSAAPDVGWPDCFNSGVFVYRPSEETYGKLVQFALDKGSFDGGDQGLLNLYFSDWAHKDISKHLPFIYNMCSTACYSYLPAFKQFGANVKIIHFIGSTKPWLQYFDTETRQVHVTPDLHHIQGLVQLWWNIFCSNVHSTLSSQMGGLAGAFAQLTLGAPRTAEQRLLEDHLRRQGWEAGNIDYMGRDSFDNIWTKICETLSVSPAESAQPAAAPAAEPTPPPPESKPATEPVKPADVDSTPKEIPKVQEPVAPSEPKPVESKPAEVAAPQPSEPPKPAPESPKPVPESPQPAPESPKPAPESPQPVPESPKPAPEPPKPAAEPPKPAADPPKPAAEPPKPAAEPPKPAAAPPKPTPESPQPAPESPKPTPVPSEPLKLAAAPPKPAPEPPKKEPTTPKAEESIEPPQIPKSPQQPEPKPVPASPKPQQTPPTSPAPAAQPKLPPPLKTQTPPTSPPAGAQPPKTPPAGEAAAAAAPETPPATESGPSPPPRKSGGGDKKKGGKAKK